MLSLPVAAQDLAIKVEHETTVLSADGVTRIIRFGERLVRRDNQSWMARILPAGAHEEADHAVGGKGHKHMDLAAAARWVVRDDAGKLRVRVVDTHEKVVVDVAPVDYGNIGFDGQWTSASQLLDPEQIKRMKPLTRNAPAGARWYEGGGKDVKVQVLWDEKDLYPRRIDSANSAGTQRSTMIVTREAMPVTLPWSNLGAYVQKEYSDLLD
jgi:hypothetical protein